MNTAIVKVQRLIGKNKALAASITTLGGVLAADAYSLIATGGWNVTETRTAVGAVALAAITYAFTYAVPAGDAEVNVPEVAAESQKETPRQKSRSSWG